MGIFKILSAGAENKSFIVRMYALIDRKGARCFSWRGLLDGGVGGSWNEGLPSTKVSSAGSECGGGDWKIVGSDRVLPLLNTVSGSSPGRARRHRASLSLVI